MFEESLQPVHLRICCRVIHTCIYLQVFPPSHAFLFQFPFPSWVVWGSGRIIFTTVLKGRGWILATFGSKQSPIHPNSRQLFGWSSVKTFVLPLASPQPPIVLLVRFWRLLWLQLADISPDTPLQSCHRDLLEAQAALFLPAICGFTLPQFEGLFHHHWLLWFLGSMFTSTTRAGSTCTLAMDQTPSSCVFVDSCRWKTHQFILDVAFWGGSGTTPSASYRPCPSTLLLY